MAAAKNPKGRPRKYGRRYTEPVAKDRITLGVPASLRARINAEMEDMGRERGFMMSQADTVRTLVIEALERRSAARKRGRRHL